MVEFDKVFTDKMRTQYNNQCSPVLEQQVSCKSASSVLKFSWMSVFAGQSAVLKSTRFLDGIVNSSQGV